jgi:hypothetical protein
MTNIPAQPGIGFAPGAVGPTPAPIHDIVGPLPFGTFSPLTLVLVLLALAASVLAARFFLRRKVRIPTPQEAALEALGRLRADVSGGEDHEFGVRVSDVLRRFLGEALGLAAPRQTTEEFLQSLSGSLRFLPLEQEALAEFLSHADRLKYARGEATPEQRLSLISAAESFVRGGARPEEVGSQDPSPAGKEDS